MKKYLIFSTAVFIFCFARAQETTYGGKKIELTPSAAASMASVMIISFDDRMYRSDVDREIGTHNGMDQGQILRFFQEALPATATEQFARHYRVKTLGETNPDSAAQLLSVIHESLRYEYVVLREESDSSNRKPFMKREKTPQKSGLIDGQIVVREDPRERYMKATIINDTLLAHLRSQYDFDYMLIFSEMDVTYFVEDPNMAAYGGIKKQIKTHYTIYSDKGRIVDSGAKKAYLENEERDIHLIAAKSLPEVTQKILASFMEKTEKEGQEEQAN